MIRLTTILLAGLLLLPFIVTTAEAKAPSAAPQLHVVKPGDTLYEIARRHGLSVNELKRLNGLNSNRLKLGQKLALNRAAAPPLPKTAAAKPLQAKATRPAAGKDIHVVKKGDTLSTIARRHQLSVDELKDLNRMKDNRIEVGQRLALSGAAEAEPVSPARSRQATSDVHVVKKGDTLQAIARRHGTTVNELKRVNGLGSSRLKIGQRLALSDPDYAPSPLLLPGDASEDEVLEMAYSSNSGLEQAAFGFLSTPYRFGGNSRKGIDCSAFVQQVFREVEVDLPRSAREQYRVGAKIERDQMQKGDLIFFRTYARFPSHVGIYLGEGKMIHASSRSRRVVVTSIDHPYYVKRYIGARRISLLNEQERLQEQLDTASADAPAENEVETATTPVETLEATDTVATDAPRKEGTQVAAKSMSVLTPAATRPGDAPGSD